MADRAASTRPAQRRGKSSTKRRSRKRCPQAQRDSRVNIGLAFERWRELKATNGLKTDAEVALSLLDVMKRPPSSPTSSTARPKKIRFSQLEVERLIEQEVHTAVQKKETKLQGLIETIQQLDRSVDYESSLRKLEARVNTVTKRAEAAIAFTTEKQNKSPLPSLVTRTEKETLETTSQTDSNVTDESGENFKMMENTKEALKKMQADNEALKGAITDLSEELPPPVLTPYGSPDSKAAKRHTTHKRALRNDGEGAEQREEPKAGPAKAECLPLRESDSPTHADCEREKLLYPPLPSNTFPSTLNMEAASFNIPQRLQVQLALIRKPPGLSVAWKGKEDELSQPPMASYRVFITEESVKGGNVFLDWTSHEVAAETLPMCVMTSKYMAGRKICVAVVGKDTFGRYGPYSKVVTVSLPD
ncbi:activating transcription factor 7-interacting protein 2 isoform X2 [Cebidichthys violaceus]|uniref:activating transcription factor 7-interacting protein 2 isoform X2 n=1 Tax=Cebidichthys violaceus TaxID=271503 RepID=UPI0035C9ADE4